jgi:thiamine-phosphate diphosphorylase
LRFPRFYPLLDTALLAARGFPVPEAARILLEAGVRILQLRHKGPYTREVFEHAETIARWCREAGATFIVNDRADVALLVDAGLHVGQRDLAPRDARRLIGDSRPLGFSTHNEGQLRAALSEPVDYLAFGPVFSTASKPDADPVAGLGQLARLRPLVGGPLVAIGGITRDRAARVLAAGADSVAVIGDLYPAPLTAVALRHRAEEWLAVVPDPQTPHGHTPENP